ncbi:2-dehydro-3-deoxy-D-gluconate 5-dehydrogenase KduD [Anaeroselena agilis]|uniref:2-dehydro-3-deoxy-D-gluconate 5-dehydrogenase KduD n=1 Tax=Anaeroselena agilis TaxID=3063788 RepID=A0ABU3NUT8_9FIRM|nr:2-dehydro-3-deoxy-D-gluconate 5-dehydrogenase KduD [Selenomonadales bacterium 4137-cl]
MILDQFSLAGKVAIVTGASRGLGAGMAIGLAEAGADLVVVASSARIHDTAASITALGRKCVAVQTDLTDVKTVPAVIDAALKNFGKIDILVNCAGIIRRAPALEFTEKDWDDVMNVNLKTMFFMCQAAAKEMMKQGKGKIVNIASLLSFQGGIIVPSYTASKSGVAGLTKALANEWAAHGINVNAIAPGYMATEMTEALQKSAERAPAILARIPQGRWGTPEDMKGAAVYLASAASDYLQGHVLVVDGGWMGR